MGNLEFEYTVQDYFVEYDITENTSLSEEDTSRDSDYQPYSRKSKPVQIILGHGSQSSRKG